MYVTFNSALNEVITDECVFKCFNLLYKLRENGVLRLRKFKYKICACVHRICRYASYNYYKALMYYNK